MITRRHLLGGAACAAAGASLVPTLGGFAARAADVSGYKALVCLFLRGGIDCHDTVLPYDQPSYDSFASIRQPLINTYAGAEGVAANATSRALSNLLELPAVNAADFGPRAFALPSQLQPLHALFVSGKAAIVGNVGPLIAPLNRSQFQAGTVPTPRRLFSHNDQQSTWVSSEPEGAQFGWGGRFADAALASSANTNPAFTAISLSGNDVFLSGEQARQYKVSTNGAQEIRELEQPRLLGGARDSDLANQLIAEHFRAAGFTRANLFERDIVDASARSIDSNTAFNAALEQGGADLQTAFPDSSLGRQLRAVAETIAARGPLGASRQVFFTATGGFDTHSGQAGSLAGLQTNLAASIAAFHAATVELGVENEVVLFTVSDFGRTLIVNGDGTDHGWGGHQFVVGGAVDGGKIFGSIPTYDVDHDLDSGRGRLIPSTSVEQFAAPLGRWFGLTEDELNAAIPGLAAFEQSATPFV